MPGRYSRGPQHAPQHRAPSIPIHRGPQAMTAAQLGGFHHAPNAALLIDFDNVTMGIRSDLDRELRTLLSSDIIKGKVAVQRAYADWRRYVQYVTPLTAASIDMIMAPAYGSAKKNATDIRLAVDAMELVFTRPEIGTFILLSGDSDFTSLVMKLKEYGKYVIGVGIRESSSDLLVQNCDEYYSYNALAGLVRTGDEETVRWDPWELVVESVGRMVKNGDVMRADRLKQVMQDVDPNFDEKDLGMSKFSRFVHEAEKRGLLTLTRQENGQYEIGPRGASAPAAPAAAAAATVPTESAEQAERDRAERDRSRRGRGRGRGRGERYERGVRRDEGEEAGVLPGTGDTDTEIDTETLPLPLDRGTPAPSAPAFTIGAGGERLTRAEAFDLVRRAVESLTRTEEDTVSGREVRMRAFELLGRDSESLSERMFVRILQDAHDQDAIDLRRRGDDHEVSRSAQADSVADQLNRAAAAAQAAEPVPTPVVAPRGMGPRGGGGRAGSRGPAGRAAPPAELLAIGVVAPSGGAAAASATPSASAPELESAPAAPAESTLVVAPEPAETSTAVPMAAAQPAAAPAQPPRRGRGPAGRGAPPPNLLSIGVVSPVVPPTSTPAPAATPAAPRQPEASAPVSAPASAPDAADDEITTPEAANDAPASRAGRSRGGRGRGRGARGAAESPATTAPAAAPVAAPTRAPAPVPAAAGAPAAAAPAAAPAPAGRGRGRGAAKTGAKTASKTVAKVPTKAAAKEAAPARAPRAGARKTAAKRGA